MLNGIKAYPITQEFHTKNDCFKAARVREKTKALAQVAKGDTLTVTGNADAAGWFKVRKGTTEGFADGKYLVKIESDTSDEASGMGGGEEAPEDDGAPVDAEMALVPMAELARLRELVEEIAAQMTGRAAELSQVIGAWIKGNG